LGENESDLAFVVVEFNGNLSRAPCWMAELKTFGFFFSGKQRHHDWVLKTFDLVSFT
jgi:hypothetical protein